MKCHYYRFKIPDLISKMETCPIKRIKTAVIQMC